MHRGLFVDFHQSIQNHNSAVITVTPKEFRSLLITASAAALGGRCCFYSENQLMLLKFRAFVEMLN
jgi:hypothetical protein